MKKAINILSLAILIIGLAITAVFAIPLLKLPGGYQVVIVRSGSMEPTIPTGAVAFFKPESEYQADDVIAFHVENEDERYAVIHRAVEKTTDEDGKTAFVTKGDANESKDAVKTPVENILGTVFYHIPVVGYVVSWIQTTTGRIVLIGLPITLLVYHQAQEMMAKKKSTSTREHTSIKEQELHSKEA
jgi:signal peptidase